MSNRYTLTIILAALVLFSIAAVITLNFEKNKIAQRDEPLSAVLPLQPVIYASRDISKGCIIAPADVDIRIAPRKDTPCDAMDALCFVVGNLSTCPISKGDIIYSSYVSSWYELSNQTRPVVDPLSQIERRILGDWHLDKGAGGAETQCYCGAGCNLAINANHTLKWTDCGHGIAAICDQPISCTWSLSNGDKILLENAALQEKFGHHLSIMKHNRYLVLVPELNKTATEKQHAYDNSLCFWKTLRSVKKRAFNMPKESYPASYLRAMESSCRSDESRLSATVHQQLGIHVTYWYERGQTANNDDEFITKARIAIANGTANSHDLVNVALADLTLGRLDSAKAKCDRAISLDQRSWTIYDARGRVELELKDYNGAISDFDHATSIDQSIGSSYFFRGQAYRALGQITFAIRDESTAHKLGFVPVIHEEPDSSYFTLPKIIPLSRELTADDFAKVSYFDLGYDDKAAKLECDQAILMNSKCFSAYENRGQAELNLKMYQEAISDLSTCVSLNQKYSRAYFLRALTYLALGKTDLARADKAQAQKLGFPVEYSQLRDL